MPRLPRWIPDHSLVEISNRCFQGRFLLRPSPELKQAILGVLGRALARYPVRLHYLAVLSNHYHLLATFPSTGVMSKFMAYFDRNVSIEVGKLYGWRGPMWEGRYHHSIVDDEPAIQIQRLRYLLSQGVKEGLVYSPLDWPGVHTAEALMTGQPLRGVWIDRKAIWVSKNRREAFDPAKHTQETLAEVHPLPCWAHLPVEESQRRVAELVQEVESEARAAHRRAGTRPAGVRSVVKRHPHHRPRKVAWSPAPKVLAGSKKARWTLWRAVQAVATEYWAASERLAEGVGRVVFPEGTFPPRSPYVPSPADLRLELA